MKKSNLSSYFDKSQWEKDIQHDFFAKTYVKLFLNVNSENNY